MKKFTWLMSSFCLLFFGMVSISMAKSTAIMYPYVVGNPGVVSTLLTFIQTDTNVTKPYVHMAYWVKGDPNDVSSACQHSVDFFVESSENNIAVFDAANFIENGNAMFGDNVTKELGGNPLGIDNGGVAWRGFVAMEALSDSSCAAANFDGNLTGEAMVLELVNGAAWGYAALEADTANSAVRVCNVTADVFMGPQVNFRSPNATPVGIKPMDEFKTVFFVTPLGDDNVLGGSKYDSNATVTLMNDSQNGFWNMNEIPYSGVTPQRVVCTAAISLDDFVTVNSRDRIADGGWAYFTNASANDNKTQDNDVWAAKLEYGNPSWANGMINGVVILDSDPTSND